MDTHTRTYIAAIVKAVVSGDERISAIYSYEAWEHLTMSGTISHGRLQLYDHDRSEHVTGSMPSFYDHGSGDHFTLSRVADGQFNGYDHATASHFTASANGGSITVYDYGTGQYYQYS